MDIQLKHSVKFTYDYNHQIIKSELVQSTGYKIDQLLQANLLDFIKHST